MKTLIEIAEHIVENNLTEFTVPPHVNYNSLRAAVYRQLKEKGLKRKIATVDETMFIQAVATPSDVDLSFLDNLTTEHLLAVPSGIRVQTIIQYIHQHTHRFSVTRSGSILTINRVFTPSTPKLMTEVRQWVRDLPYCEPTPLKDFGCNDATIRMMLSKMKTFHCSLRGGMVTKYRYRFSQNTLRQGKRVIGSYTLATVRDTLLTRGILTQEVMGL